MLDPMINRRAATAIFLSSVIGLFTAGRIDAGINHWTTYGPTLGGQPAGISVLALSASHPRTLYAGVWDPLPNTTFASSLFKSTDGGSSWSETTLVQVAPIMAIVVDPSSDDRVLVGTALPPVCAGPCVPTGPPGLYASTDGGTSWSDVSGENTGLLFATSLAIDPVSSGVVYAGTYQGLYKSTDGGTTWEQKGEIGTSDEIGALLTIDPEDHSVIYATTDYGLYKTTDGMETWIGPLLGGDQNPSLLTAVTVDPADSLRIWIGSYSGLYRSSDGGTTWDSVPSPASWVTGVQFDPGNPLNLYLRTWNGDPLYRSANGGSNWASFGDGLPGYPLNTLVIDASGQYLYAGSAGVYDLEIPHEPARVQPLSSAPTAPISGRP
jgi:hypothetical protein